MIGCPTESKRLQSERMRDAESIIKGISFEGLWHIWIDLVCLCIFIYMIDVCEWYPGSCCLYCILQYMIYMLVCDY